MSLNIVLDHEIILDLLSLTVNDTQHCFNRIRKPNIYFWMPACLAAVLEGQINANHHQPLAYLFAQDVQALTALGGHWKQLSERRVNRLQALISLDAAILPGRTVIWTNQERFDIAEAAEAVEWGDHEFLYGVLSEDEYAADIHMNDLINQQLILRNPLEQNLFKTLQHGRYVMGPEIEELERRLADFVEVKHCITVANGTDALLLALLAVDVSALDEVVTSAFSFAAAAEMIAFIGAKPVFVDIDADTYNLDVNLLEAAITPQTRAIIPVNLYGQCADFDTINAIAREHNLAVIEDAGQSFGAQYKKRFSGGLAMIGCTSFFPAKTLGAYGDGGACFTNDDLLADKLRRLRVHGQRERYHHELIGMNSRLDSLQAGVLLAKLQILPQELAARMQVGQRYTELLKTIVKTPSIAPYSTGIYSQYTIEVEQRDLVRDQLAKRGIPTAVHYPIPLHKQPAFSFLAQDNSVLSTSEAAAKRVLSLPMDSYLTAEKQQEIVKAVKAAVG